MARSPLHGLATSTYEGDTARNHQINQLSRCELRKTGYHGGSFTFLCKYELGIAVRDDGSAWCVSGSGCSERRRHFELTPGFEGLRAQRGALEVVVLVELELHRDAGVVRFPAPFSDGD